MSRREGSHPKNRALLVLDGCTRQVVVGQERVELKDLLLKLFSALPNLVAAVSMRSTGPTCPGRVGLLDENVVVVEGLDNRR